MQVASAGFLIEMRPKSAAFLGSAHNNCAPCICVIAKLTIAALPLPFGGHCERAVRHRDGLLPLPGGLRGREVRPVRPGLLQG